MKTPFERENAGSMTRHNLLFEKPEWKAFDKSRRVRELGSFVVGAVRSHHDYLHNTIKPVPVPGVVVLDAMYEFGREYVGWQNDRTRIDRILDNMIGFAKATRSPEQCHQMIEVATSIEAQMGVLAFMKNIKPRYE